MSLATLDDHITAAIGLAPDIRNLRQELDETRHLPSSLARKMADAQLFSMNVPQSLGGPELPPLTSFRVIEELSRVEGSVGWCAMIATSLSLCTAWLLPDVAVKMFGAPADVRIAGSIRPEGRALAVEAANASICAG